VVKTASLLAVRGEVQSEKFSLEQSFVPAVPSVIVMRSKSGEMVTKMKIIEFAAVAVLLGAGILWHYAAQQSLLFPAILCGGSLLAVYHASRAQKRFMAWEFLGVAFLFNPLLPLFRAGDSSLLAVWISIAAIVTCLTALKTQPLLSIPSITDRTPGSESL
jgi:hypothetical protein